MYGITMYVDGLIELFNITNSTIEGIIEDINHDGLNIKVNQNEKYISINSDSYEATYFYSREERKDHVLSLMDVF